MKVGDTVVTNIHGFRQQGKILGYVNDDDQLDIKTQGRRYSVALGKKQVVYSINESYLKVVAVKSDPPR